MHASLIFLIIITGVLTRAAEHAPSGRLDAAKSVCTRDRAGRGTSMCARKGEVTSLRKDTTSNAQFRFEVELSCGATLSRVYDVSCGEAREGDLRVLRHRPADYGMPGVMPFQNKTGYMEMSPCSCRVEKKAPRSVSCCMKLARKTDPSSDALL